jgi:hypothetical protein
MQDLVPCKPQWCRQGILEIRLRTFALLVFVTQSNWEDWDKIGTRKIRPIIATVIAAGM